MDTKVLEFLIYCAFIFLKTGSNAQTAQCIYELYQYPPVYYSCHLNTSATNTAYTNIIGQHESGNNDDDVKGIKKHESIKSKDFIGEFTSIFCKKFKNLKTVDMRNVGLKQIDEDSLLNCRSLIQLFLSNNKLVEIPEYLLIRSTFLTKLILQSNQLTTLHENTFLNQKRLKRLEVDRNRLNFLPPKVFRPLVNLEGLFLQFNDLKTINPNWFTGLEKLHYLVLNNNKIVDVPSNSFASQLKVIEFYLYDNKIRNLYKDSFKGLESVVEMQIHKNEIADMPANLFSPMQSLEYLYLFENKLTTIHSDTFKDVEVLSSVRFDSNMIDAIDPKLFDIIPLTSVNLENNTCSQSSLSISDGFKTKLKKCIDNYRNRGSCTKTVKAKGTIIGGMTSNQGDFPWIAALVTPSGEFFCGGSLITNRKVLTAAHCIQEKKSNERLFARDMFVQLGVYNLDRRFEPERKVYSLQSVTMHPDWHPFIESFDADIAVLVTNTEVKFNSNIQPICIVQPNTILSEMPSGFVAGYGKSEDDTKTHENIPKVLEMPIHDNVDCFLKNNVLATISSKRTFCGGSGNGRGVCVGDSGSGFIVTDGNAYYLRGVVSSSLFSANRQCDVDTYSVFTDILSYIDWINKIPTSRSK